MVDHWVLSPQPGMSGCTDLCINAWNCLLLHEPHSCNSFADVLFMGAVSQNRSYLMQELPKSSY